MTQVLARGYDAINRCATLENEQPSEQWLNKIASRVNCALARSKSGLKGVVQESRMDPINVSVIWHVVYGADGVGDVNSSTVRENAKLLDTYIGRNIGLMFQLEAINYYDCVGNSSFDTSNDRGFDFRVQTRVGGPETLNIWSVPEIEDGILGFATFPWANDTGHDGIVIDAHAMLGVAPEDSPNNLGRVLVHEAGHWLGLVHTFEGGCDRKKWDVIQVDDLPPQDSPSSGCPVGRNSCPDHIGFDPIHNFMDYSNDACFEDFSLGQYSLMRHTYVGARLTTFLTGMSALHLSKS